MMGYLTSLYLNSPYSANLFITGSWLTVAACKLASLATLTFQVCLTIGANLLVLYKLCSITKVWSIIPFKS